MSRRHQVGRELDAAEAQAERVGQRADHERLGQAGHADEQAMAAGEDGDEQFFQHALLADDGLAHLLADAAIAVVEPFDGGQIALDARPRLAGASAHRRLDGIDGVAASSSSADSQAPQPHRRRPPAGICMERPQVLQRIFGIGIGSKREIIVHRGDGTGLSNSMLANDFFASSGVNMRRRLISAITSSGNSSKIGHKSSSAPPSPSP